MIRFLSVVLGAVLCVIGVILTPLPIPLGLPLVAVGLAVLISSSQLVRDWVRERRTKNPGLEHMVVGVERRLPPRWRIPFVRTRPRKPPGVNPG